MSKRPINTFFEPASKKHKTSEDSVHQKGDTKVRYQNHPSYPIPLPSSLPLPLVCNATYKLIENLPNLSLHYYEPLFPAATAKSLFTFLLEEFPWYRVTYEVRGMTVNTPRFTTVFGLDESHEFEGGEGRVLEVATGKPPTKPLRCTPRPLPGCLKELKNLMERETGERFNFCLLNYYKDGKDSISYHSDDEHFLGPLPSIASLSLGSARNFVMRLKGDHTIKFKANLKSGDMILMKNESQSKWEHSVPKRAGNVGPRMNLTFRQARVRYGSENYYRYNVHDGPYFRWDPERKEMILGTEFEAKTSLVQSTEIDSVVQPPDLKVPKLDQEPSFDIAAQIAAIDEAVAATETEDLMRKAL